MKQKKLEFDAQLITVATQNSSDSTKRMNLKFLLDAGLISDENGKLKSLLDSTTYRFPTGLALNPTEAVITKPFPWKKEVSIKSKNPLSSRDFLCSISGPAFICIGEMSHLFLGPNIDGFSYSWTVVNNNSGAHIVGDANYENVTVIAQEKSGTFDLQLVVKPVGSRDSTICKLTVTVGRGPGC